jgi:S-adenosylmethionine decarboxylase
LALSAIAVSGAGKPSWLRRLIDRFRPNNIIAPPIIRQEEGWTLIHCDDIESFERWLGHDEGLPFKEDEEPSLGSHLLVELYGCDGRMLEQETTVGNAMREAAVESEATVVAQSFHEFKPFGVSGAVIIQESHYTIHTWPEHGYAAVDLFYCGGTVKVHKAIEVLRERFRPTRIKFLVVRRGLKSEVSR